ncbi:LYR motif-containing protein 4-like [Ctenocephalides felis]|uniref:LYR motif-containing protein 4-like n=1 Tax=Ctenocephalides felis TaxID=7515 RepID=UPI000E6E58B2|nr:LYR motif-containing protein 4-like [Ctenocephalides felis]XP_026465496.1 LYR motif-containing protein 4-like [Ctenocephalides felis]
MSKMEILKLYKMILRESQKISAYNYRMYAIRRVRDAFRENKNLTDKKSIDLQLQFGAKNLEIIKRQALIGNMFDSTKLVIEK